MPPTAAATALALGIGSVVVADCSTGGPDRGPTAVIEAEFVAASDADGGEPRQLHLTIAACNASPEITFQEFDDRIVVLVIADLPGRDADGCADEGTIVMTEPLDDRQLVDASTGEPIPIIDPETGEPVDS